MKKIFFYILLSLAINITIMQIVPAFAAENQPYIPQPGTLPGPTEQLQENAGTRKSLINTLIPKMTTASIGMAAGLATLFLIIGGLRYVISFGKDESLENAKKQIIYALAGLLLAILSYIIVLIVINLKFVEDSGF